MVRFDTFLKRVRNNEILTDNKFELLTYDKGCNVITVMYKGAYFIVDDGYLAWSCNIPPFSATNKIDETRWSRWAESMCKDVECTFGILKGRWQILKTGVCVYGVDKVDDIWMTCCALHEWLLEIDRISGQWEDGALVSDWEGNLGRMDFDGLRQSIPNAIAQLSTNLDTQTYNLSDKGPGANAVGGVYCGKCGVEDDVGICTSRSVNSMSLAFFYDSLLFISQLFSFTI